MSPAPGVAGTALVTPPAHLKFSAWPAARSVTEYPTEVLEIGIRSNVGIQVNGLTNTIEGGYTYSNIDAMACPANAFGGVDDLAANINHCVSAIHGCRCRSNKRRTL